MLKRKMWVAFIALAVVAGGAVTWLALNGTNGIVTAREGNADMQALLDKIREQQRSDSRKPGRTEPVTGDTNEAAQSPPKLPNPPKPVPSASADTSRQALTVLDLNIATLEQLMELPGLGEAKAKAIIELRQKLGKFDNVEQLTEVKGIGKKILEKLRPFVRVGSADG